MTVSRTAPIDGPVHYEDHGGDGPPMLLVHGLGGTVQGWHLVTDRLTEHHRVYAIDLVGFGRTEPGPRSVGVEANAALIHRFIEEIIGEPAIVVGNSMGGLVSSIAAAERPDLVTALVLVAPAVPAVNKESFSPSTLRRIVVPALPGVGAAALKRYWTETPIEVQLDEAWQLLAADPSRIDAGYLQESRQTIERRLASAWAPKAFSDAARSIGVVLARRGRHAKMIHRISAPTLLIQGDEDRIVIPEAALRLIDLRPDWDVVVLEGVGHVPMVETPERFLDAMIPWLSSLELEASL